MNPYELITMIQSRMQQDPVFAMKFNQLVQRLNSMPGLQDEVMRIIKIQDDRKRQKAINKLPGSVKSTVEEMIRLINSR